MKDATDQEKWATGLIKKYYQDRVRNINRTSAGTTCDASPCAVKQAKSEKAARLAAAQAEAAASSDGGMLTPILVAVFGVPAGSVSAHPKKTSWPSLLHTTGGFRRVLRLSERAGRQGWAHAP